MSTQINVTVDSGGLADEDKQQRQSMRWAKLEKDGKSLVYRTGLDERGKALSQQGKDPTGKPKPTTPAPVLRRDEPAAFRSATDDFLMLLPSGNGKVDATSVPLVFYLDAKGQWSSRFEFRVGYTDYVYLPEGGPAGSPALSTGPEGSILNKYIFLRAPYFHVNTRSRYKSAPITGFTLEFFVWWPPIYPIGNFQTYYPWDYLYVAIFGGTTNERGLAGIKIEIERGIDPEGIDYRFTEFVVNSPGTQVASGRYNRDQDRVSTNDLPGSDSPFKELQWQHIALVSKQVMQGGSAVQHLAFYVDGVQYGNTGLPTTTPSVFPYPEYLQANAADSYVFDFSIGGSNSGTGQYTGPMKMHGLKLTPKALYDGNFTPPSKILA